ncbi:CRISPR system precrRNA processing endoribonuclease RAMP protein Cas6 [Trichococcus shcherbakoviae]|uniref:CRISPR system precrRNA processing endoribonuclease RAMP protein Cas6 n=1 Tax=Trichococcus shcherbakoviae TaxID=2094020 RepID=UPI0029F574F7|nr:CRISPR system precrRNA processing endoribonuclease RAMP protein Cas6 [Trichococcus shcherbakoviae]
MQRFDFYCEWDGGTELDYRSASLFHGVIMHALPASFSEHLHKTSVAEFHQKLEFGENALKWTIHALTDECAGYVEESLYQKMDTFYLKQKQIELRVVRKESSDNLSYYEWYCMQSRKGEPSNKVRVAFSSPASFKSYNTYLEEPNLSLCYRSLAMRLGSVQETIRFPKKIWEHLADQTSIRHHAIEKCSFPLEKVNIPAFKGEMILELQGDEDELLMMNLLWDFANFAGLGIKTAVGMGQTEVTFL